MNRDALKEELADLKRRQEIANVGSRPEEIKKRIREIEKELER